MSTSTKIGEHNDRVTEWTGRAPLALAFKDVGLLKKAHPAAWKGFRAWLGDWDRNRGGLDIANAVITQLGDFRDPKLFIELYVGVPQSLTDGPDPADPAGSSFSIVCDHMEAAVKACHAHGIRFAGPSFYTGQPEPVVWAYMASRNWCGMDPAIDLICVQEYTNNGTVDDPGNIGRFTAVIDAGWTGGIVIGECGMDRNGNPTTGGYLAWSNADQMYAFLHAYDALLAKYPQVKGAAVFSAEGWPSFEFNDDRKEFTMTIDYEAEVARIEKVALSLGATDLDIGNAVGDDAAMDGSLDAPTFPHDLWTTLRMTVPALAHVPYPQPDIDPSQPWPQFAATLTPCDDPNATPQQTGEYEVVDPNDPVIVDLKNQLNTVHTQMADFTQALRDLTEGKYQGASGAAGEVVALEGGNDPSIQPQPDYVPKA